MPAHAHPLLTPADVAERLAVDTAAVLALIRSGALPASDVALPGAARRRWRIAASDLADFLAARRHRQPEPRRRGRRVAEPEVRYF